MAAWNGNDDGRPSGSLLSAGVTRPRKEHRPVSDGSLLSIVASDGGPTTRDATPPQADRSVPRKSARADPPAPAAVRRESLAAWVKARFQGMRDRRAAKIEATAPPAARLKEPVAAAPVPVEPASERTGSQYWQPLIDPVKVVSGVTSSKRLILASTTLGAMLGIAIALSTPKTYESTTELLVDPRNLNIVEREITQSGLPSDATLAIVENQARVMTSGSVIDKVVERLNLPADPEFNGRGGTFSLRGMVSELRGLLSGGDGGEEVDTRQAVAVGNLYDALTIERGSKTFVISVSARTHSAEKSALIANTVAEVFLETYGELQAGSAGRATQELTGRLDELRAGVEAAERRVEAFKQQNEIIDPQGRLITDDEIVKLNEQLSVARARTLELNARADSTRGVGVNDVIEGTLPEQAASGLITELRSQYANLKQEADRLAVRLGPRHPQRLSTDAQLAGAREQIQNELRRLNAGIQVDLKRAVQLEQDLAARLARLKVQKGDLSNELVTLRELERDATSKRAVYEAYLLRARETGEQQSLNTANVSVISKAHPALLPSGPSRSTIVMAFTLLGLAAGVGIGAVRGAARSFRENSEQRRFVPRAAAAEPRRTIPLAKEPTAPADETTEDDRMHSAYRDDQERQYQPDMHAPHHAAPAGPAWAAPSAAYPAHGQPGPHTYWQPQPMPAQSWQRQPFQQPQPWQQDWHHQQMPPPGYAPPPHSWQVPAYPPVPQEMPHGYGAPPGQQADYGMAQPPHLAVVPSEHAPGDDDRSPFDEIRESLREVREAIRELSENRKRRYF